jgi:hypothetical protein
LSLSLYSIPFPPFRLTSFVETAGQILIPDTQEGYGTEGLGLLHDRTRLSNRNLYPFFSIVHTISFIVPSGLVVNSHYVYGTSATEAFTKVLWNKRKCIRALTFSGACFSDACSLFKQQKYHALRRVSDQVMPLSAYATNNLSTCALSHRWRRFVRGARYLDDYSRARKRGFLSFFSRQFFFLVDLHYSCGSWSARATVIA